MALERGEVVSLMGGDRNVELLYFSPSLPSRLATHSSHPLPSLRPHQLRRSPIAHELFRLDLIYGVNSAPSVQ